MKYRDRTTGQIYTLFDIQQKFSHVSFPLNWDSTTFDFANVDPVVIVPEPLASTACKKIEYTGVQFINNQWIDTWNELPLYSNSSEQTICEEELITIQWNYVRNIRNIKLSETDYTQISDSPITSASRANFITYRQALRDVTNQPDPYNITWPAVPNYEKE